MPDIFELIQQLCPDGVEYRRLGEVADVRRGVRVVKSQLSDAEGYPVYQNSLMPLGFFNSSNACGGTSFLIVAGSAGSIGYSDVSFWAADDCFYFPTNALLLSKFIYYVLLRNSSFLSKKVRKASVPRLSRIVFEGLRIPVPPLSVQQEIVRILDTFDTYCNDMTSGLAGELAMRRKQFQYWRETLIDQQTDHMVALGDLGQFQNGHGISKSELMDEGPVPVIHYGQIYTMYNHAVLKTVSFAGTQTAVSVKAHHGDVVVCLTETADLGFVGKAVAQVSGVDVGVSGDAGVLHLNPDEVDASYLAYVMETQRFQVQKERCKRGTTVMHLNIPLWKKIRVPVPPLAVQLEIVHILDVFMELERELERELELRVKQFEYYRDHLLVFPEKSAA